jgi:hypothetical protein
MQDQSIHPPTSTEDRGKRGKKKIRAEIRREEYSSDGGEKREEGVEEGKENRGEGKEEGMEKRPVEVEVPVEMPVEVAAPQTDPPVVQSPPQPSPAPAEPIQTVSSTIPEHNTHSPPAPTNPHPRPPVHAPKPPPPPAPSTIPHLKEETPAVQLSDPTDELFILQKNVLPMFEDYRDNKLSILSLIDKQTSILRGIDTS